MGVKTERRERSGKRTLHRADRRMAGTPRTTFHQHPPRASRAALPSGTLAPMDREAQRTLHQEMARWAAPFARPVFFGNQRDAPGRLDVSSGTATLLQLGGRFIGVTCQHVVAAYRRRKRTGTADFFHFGDASIDPDEVLIDESERLDLITFDLSRVVDKTPMLAVGNFYVPRQWPPHDVSEHDVITFLGFPGVWRDQTTQTHFNFYHLGHGATSIDAIGEEHICSRIMFEESTHLVRNKQVLTSAGGLSGAPVFVWRTGTILTAELIGFIYEHQPGFDLLYIRRANRIEVTGKLLK